MDNIALTALSRVVKDSTKKSLAASLPAGEHEVDMTVRISGKLIKGEDTTKVPTVRIPVLASLALAMKFAGVTGDAAINAITAAVSESVLMDKDAAAELIKRDGIEDAIKKLNAELKTKLPRTPVNGTIKAHLDLEEVVPVAVDVAEVSAA